MDPKSIANLDPKLRETYERVMGNTSAAPADTAPKPDTNAGLSAPSTPPIPTPGPSTDFSSPVLPEQQLSSTMPDTSGNPSMGTSSIPAPADPVSTATPAAPTAAPNPMANMQPLSSPASVAQGTQNTGSIVKVLYIFGGLVFFVVYIFFWIKIFNYQLPF